MHPLFKNLFTWKTFFALFSKIHLATFAIAFTLTLLASGTEWEKPLSLITNFSLFYLCLRVATIIHECGHLVVGMLVSAKPERMVLGIGHEVMRVKVNNFKLIINARPIGGYVIAPIEAKSLLHVRHAAFFLGGVAANLMVAVVTYQLFATESPFVNIDFPSAFILANAIGIINLVPFYVTAYGTRMGSDGMQVVKLPFKKSTELSDFDRMKRILFSTELLEGKQYAQAVDYLLEQNEKFPNDFLTQYNLAGALFKVGELEQTVELANRLEEQRDKDYKVYRGYVYNIKACIFLELGNIEDAYTYAYRSHALLPKVPSVTSTYASTLIERGDIDKGIQLLQRFVDFRYPNSNTLSSAIYLMYAYRLRKNFDFASKYKKFVDNNLGLLDRDEKFLYERCLARTTEQKSVSV